MGFALSVLIVILTKRALGQAGDDHSIKIYDKQPWKAAFDQCARKGDGFIFPLTGANNDDGVQGLATWLPIRRIRYPTWKWLDNEVVDSRFEKQNWGETMNCGAIHLRDAMLESDECSRSRIGFLCDTKAEKKCKANHGHSCNTIGNRTFYYECDVNNWYQARYQCQQLNMTLAVVKSEATVKALRALYKSSDNTCNRVWVGLRREDWLYESAESRIEEKTRFKMPWASGQPSSDGNCAVSLGKSGGGSYWKSEFCGANHHWLCSRNMRHVTGSRDAWTNVPNATEAEHQSDRKTPNATENRSSMIIGVAVAAFLVLLCALGFGVVFLLYRRKRIKKCTSEEKGTNEEDEHLNNKAHELKGKDLPEPDLRIKKTLNSKGGTLSSPLSDITFDFPEEMVPEGETQQVTIKIYSDMKGERHNVPSQQFMVCPIVDISGDNKRIRGTLTFEHSVQNISAIKVLLSEIYPNGQFYWKSVQSKGYKIYLDTIQIALEQNIFAYTCTLMKNIDDMDYTRLSLAIFLDYVQTESGFQEVSATLYVIKTCHNLTDYLHHIHGNIRGVQRVIDFKESYSCISLEATEKFFITLEWGDSSWQEIGHCESETEEQNVSQKTYALDRKTDFINQPAGYKIAEYHIRREMNEPPVIEIQYAVDIDVVYVNTADKHRILTHSDIFTFRDYIPS